MKMGSGCVGAKTEAHFPRETVELDVFEKAKVLDQLISMARTSDDLAKLLLKARSKLDYAHDLHFYDFANPARDGRKLIDVLNRDLEENKLAYPVVAKSYMTSIPREGLKSLTFECFKYTRAQLVDLVMVMFDDTGLLTHHGIAPEKMKGFVSELARRYKKVPYHHFTHTFSLMQMLYCFVNVAKQSKQGSPFSRSEELALYLAALGHDLGHFGMNNLFCQAVQNVQAQVYNNTSVLENYHSYQMSHLLTEYGLLESLDFKTQQEVRSNIIAAILGTDMTKHFEITAKLKKIGSGSEKNNSFLLTALLHAVDIGNPGLPLPIAMKWAYRITQEFQDQYDQQNEQTPFNPSPAFLKYPGEKTFLVGQSKFAQAMVLPLWEHIATVFPECKGLYAQMKTNCQLCEEAAAKLP